ncbi:MAG: glycosyltransferase family 2 protein [Alphaproteobacteria bacterium]|nr:glycosyltransferase family 2 protein [Alphaproteobacteria bacterium]
MTGVSFVVTVYNKAAYLPAVLSAIFAQEGDFAREVIVVDDGSTDDSPGLLDRLCANRREARVIHQPNQGLVGATNIGVRAATQPWLKIVDGDDVLAPWATRILLDAANAFGTRIALGSAGEYRVGEPISWGALDPAQAEPYRRDLFVECLRNVPGNLSPTLIDRALYWEVGGADPRLYNADLPLLLKLSQGRMAACVKAVVTVSPLVAAGRMSGDERRMLEETNRAIVYFLADHPQLSWRQRRVALERAFGRAWKWQHRRLGATLVSRWFWLYALAKLGPPSFALPFLASTLEAFTVPRRNRS